LTTDTTPSTATPAAAIRRPPIKLLIALGIIGPITIHMILPSLPNMQRQFETDYATVQLLISVYMIVFGAAQLFIGPLADIAGRRKTLFGGLALYCLSSVLCALAPNLEMLIGLRMLQAVGACSGIVLARAIIRDHYDDRRSTKMFGYLAMGVAVGPMLAPIAGGALFEFIGWRGLFWVLAAVGAATTAFVWVFIEESGAVRSGTNRSRALFVDIVRLLRNRRFILYALNICFHTGFFYAFVVGGPYLASEFLSMTPKTYGAWFATVAVGYGTGNFIAGRLIAHFRNEAIIFAGGALVLVLSLFLVFVLVAELHSALAIFGAVGTATLSSGLVMPISYSGVLAADPKLAGSASGLVGFMQFSFAALFSTLASFAIEYWHHPVALGFVMLSAAVFGNVAAALLWVAKRV
jgi:DHA1 family bicyclomycin/chloramphenicol resistance-like MFS transporter